MYLYERTSVSDPLHFDVDPDPLPGIVDPDPKHWYVHCTMYITGF